MAKDNPIVAIIRKIDPNTANVFSGEAGKKAVKKISSYQKKKIKTATLSAYRAGKRAGFKRGKRVGSKVGFSNGVQRAQMGMLMRSRRF